MRIPVRVYDTLEVMFEAPTGQMAGLDQGPRPLRPPLLTEWQCDQPPEEGSIDSNQTAIYPDVNTTNARHFFLIMVTGGDTCTISWNAANDINVRNMWLTTDNGYQIVSTGIALTNPATGSWVFFQGEDPDDYRVYPGGTSTAIVL